MKSFMYPLQLAHPILDVLRNSQKQWLVDLLYAFNAGNIPRFDELKTHWQNQVTAQRNRLPYHRHLFHLFVDV